MKKQAADCRDELKLKFLSRPLALIQPQINSNFCGGFQCPAVQLPAFLYLKQICSTQHKSGFEVLVLDMYNKTHLTKMSIPNRFYFLKQTFRNYIEIQWKI